MSRYHAFGEPDSPPAPERSQPKTPNRKPRTGKSHNPAALAWLAGIADAMLDAIGCGGQRDAIAAWLADPATADFTTKPNTLFAAWKEHLAAESAAVAEFEAAGETLPDKQTPPDTSAAAIPGKKVSDYPSPMYEFRLPDGTIHHVFVRHSDGMKEAREKLATELNADQSDKTLPGKQTERDTSKPDPDAERRRIQRAGRKAWKALVELGVIGGDQATVTNSMRRGEEGEFFDRKMIEILDTLRAMPGPGATDGQGKSAIAHLHYFTPSGDWYITEIDRSDQTTLASRQHQAFGWADPFGDPRCAELGYISLAELTAAGAELDYHWTPQTLAACLGESEESATSRIPAATEPEPAPEKSPGARWSDFVHQLINAADMPDMDSGHWSHLLESHDPERYLSLAIVVDLGSQPYPDGSVVIGHMADPDDDANLNPLLTCRVSGDELLPVELHIDDTIFRPEHPAWDDTAILRWALDTWAPILRAGFLTGKQTGNPEPRTLNQIPHEPRP